jgi:NAD dependent epimerase/dehydratase family enzyme
MAEGANAKRRVLVTGAEGLIGSVVRERLGDRYEIRSLTLEPQDFESEVGDIADLEVIRRAFEGIDTVVHLAATAAVESEWDDVLRSNIIGTYNVYEAARLAGVKAVVFASSNHAVGMYEVDGAPEIYELDDPRVYDERAELRPDSLYGVSKVYGEALGRYYSDVHGLRVICLRIGAVRADEDPEAPIQLEAAPWKGLTKEQARNRLRAIWLSQRDCAQLIQRAVDAESVPFAIVYGVSDNPRRFFDLTSARTLLGYEPEDRAPA